MEEEGGQEELEHLKVDGGVALEELVLLVGSLSSSEDLWTALHAPFSGRKRDR